MYSVISRVDTLCLGKTGTITQGEWVSLSIAYPEDRLGNHQGYPQHMQYSEDTNPLLLQAIRKAWGWACLLLRKSIIPFSSDRKWGAMHLSNLGTVFLGVLANAHENPAAVPSRRTSSWIAFDARLGSQFRTDGMQGPETATTLKILRRVAVVNYGAPFIEGGFRYSWAFALSGVDQRTARWQPCDDLLISLNRHGFKNYENYVDSKISDDQLVDQAEETAILDACLFTRKTTYPNLESCWSD